MVQTIKWRSPHLNGSERAQSWATCMRFPRIVARRVGVTEARAGILGPVSSTLMAARDAADSNAYAHRNSRIRPSWIEQPNSRPPPITSHPPTSDHPLVSTALSVQPRPPRTCLHGSLTCRSHQRHQRSRRLPSEHRQSFHLAQTCRMNERHTDRHTRFFVDRARAQSPLPHLRQRSAL